MDIRTIIREEINRYILTENISSLSQYSNTLTQYVKTYGSTPTKFPEEKQFLNNFITFTMQVIYAVDRCVKSNSLNEANLGAKVLKPLANFKLSDYGINVPNSMGGGFFSKALQNYWNLKRKQSERSFKKQQSYAKSQNSQNNNVNNSQQQYAYGSQVKLSVLLQQIPQYKRGYINVNTKYSNNLKNESNGGIDQMIVIMEKLQGEYNQLVLQAQNAQGNQNP